MIEFHYETEFQLDNEIKLSDWINRVLISEGYGVEKVDYIFCSDDYLLKLNKEHLDHDTYTDIITFDYSMSGRVSGDIFISIDRVKENAGKYQTGFKNELLRVMSHGLLHIIGYNDKTDADKVEMRNKENEKIKLFHVEQ